MELTELFLWNNVIQNAITDLECNKMGFSGCFEWLVLNYKIIFTTLGLLGTAMSTIYYLGYQLVTRKDLEKLNLS